jgi:CheY-like chemotaxis protein
LVANSAEQGWTVLEDFAKQIWLVILDVQMPGKYDGIALLDRIVGVAQERNIQVIMMSSSQDNVVRAVEHGCDDFMAKPIVKQLLLKRVEALKRLEVLKRLCQVEKEACRSSENRMSLLTLDKLLSFWDGLNNDTFPFKVIENSVISKVIEWSFNVFEFYDDELLVLTKHMFVHLDLLSLCNVQCVVLESFSCSEARLQE